MVPCSIYSSIGSHVSLRRRGLGGGKVGLGGEAVGAQRSGMRLREQQLTWGRLHRACAGEGRVYIR